jgi:hypothetical protein
LTDLPIRLYYLYKNSVLVHTYGFCLFWNWVASVLNIIGLHLMALGSIERNLFVFHNQFLSRHRLFVSQIPMVFSIIYPTAFYTGVIFGSWWCTNSFDYSTLACGPPCYLLTSTFFPLFGILTHHVLPVFIILFSNLALIIRVWLQKSGMNQTNTWRKNIRMTTQLLSISFIYLIVWLPQCILFLMLGLGHGDIQTIAGSLIYEYTGNFTSFTIIICPYIALTGLPQVITKIKQDFATILRIQNLMRDNRVLPSPEEGRMRTATIAMRQNH